MPGRCRDVEDDVCALLDEFSNWVALIPTIRPEIFVVPNVFADSDADLATIEYEWRGAFRRFKITILVEHIIGRQQRFVLSPDDLAVLEDGGGIEE